MSGENVSKTQTVYESDSQSGLSSKEKDRSANVGLLDHFMKIFLYCRRAMVSWSFFESQPMNLGMCDIFISLLFIILISTVRLNLLDFVSIIREACHSTEVSVVEW